MQLATDGISHYWSRQDIGWQGYRANVNAIGYKKANSPEKVTPSMTLKVLFKEQKSMSTLLYSLYWSGKRLGTRVKGSTS